VKLSIIIAAYNEENSIEEILDRIDKISFPIDIEVIVIDDGSTDKTYDILKKCFDEKKFVSLEKIFKIPTNLGKASAIRIGIGLSSGDIIVTQDADLELDPEELPKLLVPILNEETEVVFGSRFLNGYQDDMKFIYKFINIFLAFLVKILWFKTISDEATAYKMYKKSVLNNITLTSSTFEYCPELTAKLLNRNYKIVEIPVNYKPRINQGNKKIRWFDGIEAIYTLIKFRFFELI